jgi:hypothetical protein
MSVDSTQPFFSPIVIHLIRPKSDKDDVIKIRPSETKEALLNVHYNDRYSKKDYRFDDSWENVAVYLKRILTVLPTDSDPFESVQFSLPAYPSLMVKVDDIPYEEDFVKTVFRMMKSVVNGWPSSPRSA